MMQLKHSRVRGGPIQVPDQILHGKRILIAEDEVLIALALETGLLDAGCVVVGPFATLDAATAGANHETVDGAIVDVRLRDELAFPLVRLLLALDIPVVVVSGYTRAILPADLADLRFYDKPCLVSALVLAVTEAIVRQTSRLAKTSRFSAASASGVSASAASLPLVRHLPGSPRDHAWRQAGAAPIGDVPRQIVQDARTGRVIATQPEGWDHARWR
jgi:DNA-binding NarL/FixJ family response regulator